MAGASRLAMRSSLLPAGAGDFLRRRSIEAAGFLLMLFAFFAALTLLSYSPTDPSLSHATSAPARNLGGRLGATVADVLLQTLGLGAALIVATIAAWGWRLMRVHHLPLWWLRLATLPLAVVLASLALAFVPAPEAWSSLLEIGLGGVVGHLFFATTVTLGQKIGLGPDGFGLLAALLSGAGRSSRSPSPGANGARWGASAPSPRQPPPASCGASPRGARASATRPTGRKQAKVAKRREPKIDDDGDEAIAIEREADAGHIRRPAPADLVASRGAAEASAKKAAPRKQSSLDLRASGKTSCRRSTCWRARSSPIAAPTSTRRAGAERAAARIGARRFRRQGPDRQGPSRPRRHSVRTRARARHQDQPRHRPRRRIARSMSAVSVRVAVIPGRNVIGIELPNISRETVYLRELLSGESHGADALALFLGKDIGGTPVNADLSRMPHLLIAGTTGSGKSVAINTMILSLLYRLAPQDCRFIMVDPKMLELSVYDGIPHLLAPVVTDPKKAVVALKWAVREMENRYRAMSKLGVRNITGYNARTRRSEKEGRGAAAQGADRLRRGRQASVRGSAAQSRGAALHRRRHRRDGGPRCSSPARSRVGRAAPRTDGARRRHPPDHGDAAPVGRRHHRHDQGELPDPHLLPGHVQDRQPHHPRRAGRRAAPRPGRHALHGGRRPHHPRARAVRLRPRGRASRATTSRTRASPNMSRRSPRTRRRHWPRSALATAASEGGGSATRSTTRRWLWWRASANARPASSSATCRSATTAPRASSSAWRPKASSRQPTMSASAKCSPPRASMPNSRSRQPAPRNTQPLDMARTAARRFTRFACFVRYACFTVSACARRPRATPSDVDRPPASP